MSSVKLSDAKLKEGSRKVQEAEEAQKVLKINRSTDSDSEMHRLKMMSIRFILVVLALVIILALTYYVSILNSSAVNAMGFSIIGAVVGALISYLLTKTKKL
ncbi:hypothetical protein MNB_SUP05-SYMBIONT-5-235 [hydrothermal vent metagenome]|uniref:Uncharacterized protein n=1 Tax=hydrothermal vent metagenome TaxID=652676 RepID=A0A1W1E0H1_9ZZZZ